MFSVETEDGEDQADEGAAEKNRAIENNFNNNPVNLS